MSDPIGRRTHAVLDEMRMLQLPAWADRIEEAIKADDLENFESAMCVLEKMDAVQAMSPVVDALAEKKAREKKSKSFTYVTCKECVRRGTSRCRHKGKRWSPSVIPGCMVYERDAPNERRPPNG